MSGRATGWVLRHYPVNSQADRTAKLVLVGVADAANQHGERSTPGVSVICAEWGFDRSTVIRHLGQLVLDGWLEITERGIGRGHAHTYRLPGMASERVAENDLLSEKGSQENRERVADSQLLTTSLTGSNSTEPTREQVPPSETDLGNANDFTAWWSQYPRKVDKGEARKKYTARRREGITAERLLAACTNYATSRQGEPERFTKHAATFLAAGTDAPWTEWETVTAPEIPFDEMTVDERFRAHRAATQGGQA